MRVALQHLDNLALAAAAPVLAGDAGLHPVLVVDAAHLARGEVDILAAIVGYQETEAVRVTDHPALHQVELVGQGVTAAPVAHQLTVTHHGLQTASQRLLASVVVDVQYPGHRIPVDRRTGLGDDLKDQFTAGDRLFVARRLAPCMRIMPPPHTGEFLFAFSFHAADVGPCWLCRAMAGAN